MEARQLQERDNGQVYKLLDQLIDRKACILSYDKSLVDQLPQILSEQHGIRKATESLKSRALVSLFDILDPSRRTNYDPAQLPRLIGEQGVDTEPYSTDTTYDRAVEWKNYSPATGDEDVHSVLTLQRDLGQGT